MTGPYDRYSPFAPIPPRKGTHGCPLSTGRRSFPPFGRPHRPQGRHRGNRRVTDRRIELDEDAKEQLDQTLQLLLERIDEQPEITVTWFSSDKKKAGGQYHTATEKLKRIDTQESRLILTDGNQIPLEIYWKSGVKAFRMILDISLPHGIGDLN